MKNSLFALLLVASGCSECSVEEPEIVIAVGGLECGDALGEEPCERVAEGAAIRVEVVLPSEVTTEEKLEVTAETPCASETVEVEFGTVDNVDAAKALFVAPAGASCQMTLRVGVANFERVFDSLADEATCGGLMSLCDPTE